MNNLLKYLLVWALLFNFVSFAGISLFATGYDEAEFSAEPCYHEHHDHGSSENHPESCGCVHTHAFIFYSGDVKVSQDFVEEYSVEQLSDVIPFQIYAKERPPRA